jgi:hypothetical protein
MRRTLLAGAALALAGAGLLVVDGSRPYPYPVAYTLGYQYREESLKEEQWQERFQVLHAAGSPGAAGVGLTRFWPRFADDRVGACASWQARRKVAPLPYLQQGTLKARPPTAEETQLEREGWIAGYLESARQHPRTPAPGRNDAWPARSPTP